MEISGNNSSICLVYTCILNIYLQKYHHRKLKLHWYNTKHTLTINYWNISSCQTGLANPNYSYSIPSIKHSIYTYLINKNFKHLIIEPARQEIHYVLMIKIWQFIYSTANKWTVLNRLIILWIFNTTVSPVFFSNGLEIFPHTILFKWAKK